MKIRIIKPTKDQIDKESLNWRFHPKEEKECKLCHSKFKYGQKKTKTCGLCKIMMVCNICNKEFEYKFSKSGREYYIDLELKNKIINNEIDNLKIVCPNCIKEYNSGYCSICNKFNLLRDGANRGRDIFYGDGEWLDENNDICGCECSHKYYLKHNSSAIMKKVSSKNVEKYLNPLKEKWKNGGICLECGKYNKILDQRGRGKDIPYNYDSEWILDKDIIDLETNKIIAHKGQKCGCNCSQKIQIDIAIKSANKKSQPGECILCHRNTKLDNPPSNRTVFGVCNICQANLVNKMNN